MKKSLLLLVLAFLLVGLVSCNTTTWRTATVTVDRHPVLTIINRTGHSIRVASPGSGNVANGGTTRFHTPSRDGGQFYVEHFIGRFSWRQQVTVTSDTTVTLTERPPVATVINNTGFPITITSPSRHTLVNGGRVAVPKQSPTANQLSVTYAVDASQFQFSEQVTINDDDVTLTLTRSPPYVTVVNNTGVTITNVFIRSPGSPWEPRNILGLSLFLAAGYWPRPGDLVGSITNGERVTFWTGYLSEFIDIGRGVFDIRLDDTHGISYVMNNVAIPSDRTLTFTQAHRP